MGVSYDADIDKVEKTINEMGEKMATEDEWKDKIIEAPHFFRVSELAESSVDIIIIGKTKANEQWGVTGELRRRLLSEFKKNEISIPYPHMVIQKDD